MTRSLFLPMIDSSAIMSAIFSRIDSRTFWRWRRRSPAERSERSASEIRYSRNIVSPPLMVTSASHFDAVAEAGFLRFAQNDTKSRVHSKIILQGVAGFSRCSLFFWRTFPEAGFLRFAQNDTKIRLDLETYERLLWLGAQVSPFG